MVSLSSLTDAPHGQVRTLENTTVEAVAPPPEQGDVTAPERIANSAAAFLDAHLRMTDVRRYMLDLLKTYAALQTFQVCALWNPPSKKAFADDKLQSS